MPVLPIPMIIALVLLAFLVQRLLTRETHATLLALIGICAMQGAVIALVQYYDVTTLRPLQPLLASIISPVAWLAFRQAAGGELSARNLWVHAAGVVLALVALLSQPMLLDILIPLSFVGYGLAMLLAMARGEDSLLHSRLEGGATPLLAWRIVAVSLIASAACDVLIAYNLAVGEGGALLWVPSVVSSLSLLSLGALGLTHAIESRRDEAHEDVVLSPEEAERDQMIVTKLDHYVSAHKPYLDPDLTLARLSRKVLVPAKPLSTAINRMKGENVSRYINRQRIDEACRLLANGANVTTAMLEAGFNTKSNFNREFLRIKNVSPRDWLSKEQHNLQN